MSAAIGQDNWNKSVQINNVFTNVLNKDFNHKTKLSYHNGNNF